MNINTLISDIISLPSLHNILSSNNSGQTINLSNVITHSPELINMPTNEPINEPTNNNRCMARMKSNLHIRCSKNKKKNCIFCGIHMRATNVLRFDEKLPDTCAIIKPKHKKNNKEKILLTYTLLKQHNFNSKKYKYRDILYSLCEYKLKNLKNKEKNFKLLQTYVVETYNKNKLYYDNIDKIRLISKIYRGYIIKNLYKAKGPGFLNRSCINNTTDFLNFTDIKDISNRYLITYKDDSNFIYGFDVRSLLSYIEELDTININNPYTQKQFSKTFIANIYIIDTYNKTHAIQDNSDSNHRQINKSVKITPELEIKRKCVSIFQRMDDLELYTQASWFLDLNILNLKKLYFLIEDIWNYRARLTRVLKKKFVTNGIAFNWPIFYIKKITNKVKIQTILLQEFEKFVYQGATKSDCVTASYWILMGLTAVSPAAAAGCPSLVQSNY